MPEHILIVDDHPLFVEALQRIISSVFPETLAHGTGSIATAKKELSVVAHFDIVLLDLALPGTRGFDGLLELRILHPKVPIVVVSALEDPRIVQIVLRCGAAGLISKGADRAEIASALTKVVEGSLTVPKGYPPPDLECVDGLCFVEKLLTLTPKQLSVFKMLRDGLFNKHIAHELQIEETTVKDHVSQILRKLDVSSRTQVVIEARRLDLDFVPLLNHFPHAILV